MNIIGYALAAVQSRPPAIPADTILARVVQERGWLDYTNGVLELLLLLMGIGVLAALIMVLLAVRKLMRKAETTMERLSQDVRPMLKHASEIASDARETVARIRGDVEQVTDAAQEVSERLLDAAAVTAQRVDEVNAVLDVVQRELEDVAISSVAAVRGVRVGAREMASALGPRSRKRRMPRGVREELEERRREALTDGPEDGTPE